MAEVYVRFPDVNDFWAHLDGLKDLHGGDGLTSCGGSCCEGFRRGTRMDEE